MRRLSKQKSVPLESESTGRLGTSISLVTQWYQKPDGFMLRWILVFSLGIIQWSLRFEKRETANDAVSTCNKLSVMRYAPFTLS